MWKLIPGISLMLCLFSCNFWDNPSIVKWDTTKSFHGRLKISLRISCPYEKRVGALRFSFEAIDEAPCQVAECRFVDTYIYQLKINWRLDSIYSNRFYDYALPLDEKVQFLIKDEKNAERKYNVDFSEMIHSFQKRGDSVDITVPSNCLLKFYSYADESSSYYTEPQISPDSLENNRFSFSASDNYYPYYILVCSWNGEDSAKTDTVETSVYVGWRHPTEEEQDY